MTLQLPGSVVQRRSCLPGVLRTALALGVRFEDVSQVTRKPSEYLSRRANWKHGYFSREAKAERSGVLAAILALRYLRNSI